MRTSGEDGKETKALSGRQFLDFTGIRRANKRNPEHSLPKLGRYIIFNQIEIAHENGTPGKMERGIGLTERYYSHHLSIKLFADEKRKNFTTTSIRINDLRIGLYRWKYLEDWRYVSDYSYEELNIDNLAQDLEELVMDK